MTPRPGELAFARYAYPPNMLGYCGPDDHRPLLQYATSDVADDRLRDMARDFDGAWPYLRLIAAANGIADPLDARVVEAYWVGNELLEAVAPRDLAATVVARAGRTSVGPEHLADRMRSGAIAHHSFHVLAVYPWLGLLRAGRTEPSLQVLERCLVRWGTVTELLGDEAIVDVVTLAWDGDHLALGASRAEPFTVAIDGYALSDVVVAGEQVALHWDWICDRLSPQAVHELRETTARTLDAVDRTERPAWAAALG